MGKLQRHKVRILGQIRKNNRQNGQKLEAMNIQRVMLLKRSSATFQLLETTL